MNGPEHYKEAEELLAFAAARAAEERGDQTDVSFLLEAHVHATLALTAALQPAGRAWADATRYEKAGES